MIVLLSATLIQPTHADKYMPYNPADIVKCDADGFDYETFSCTADNGKEIKVCSNPETEEYRFIYGEKGEPEVIEQDTYEGAKHPTEVALHFLNGTMLYKINSGKNNKVSDNTIAGSLSIYDPIQNIDVTIPCDVDQTYGDGIQDIYGARTSL